MRCFDDTDTLARDEEDDSSAFLAPARLEWMKQELKLLKE
jgi:hypothetical protein